MITRCELCPGVNNCVPPDGPQGDLLFIGEAPGKDENKRLKVFIGKTGDEVNRHYLPLAGLRRESVRVTNAIRCLPTSAGGKLDAGRTKDIELLESCARHHLYPDIQAGGYRAIVPMGSFACRAVLGEAFDLELQHGYPVETRWGIQAFPMYHPALGIHEPKKMLYIRTDWQRFRSFLSGTLLLPEDECPDPDYAEVTDESDIDVIDPDRQLAADTESTRTGEPFCLTFSQQVGTGRLIRCSRPDLLRHLERHLAKGRGHILFHNFLYDWTVVEKMGLALDHRRIVDTMARVYQLGNLPQGLKALAWRELGMTMQDFDDLVSPYSRQNVLFYYNLAQSHDWPKPDEELVIDDKTGLWKMYKPQGMNTKLKRFFTDYGKNPDKDVFQMWEKNWVEQQGMIEAECGPWPGKCITHVPFERVLYYACRDADALIRLWPVLTRMSKVVRRFSQEHWRSKTWTTPISLS